MSVLIKGMEMPESCAKCKLKIWTNTDPYCFVIQSKLEWNKYSSGDWAGIDPRCLFHPLPEKHGDLIDVNNVLDIVFEWCPDDDGSVGKMGDLREMLDEIEAIPTIVEAEGDDG